MKALILSMAILFTFSTKGIDDIRNAFQKASLNEENAIIFNELVIQNKSLEKNIHTAYLGASETLLAKYASAIGNKLKLFKSGAAHIENAIEVNPSSVEIRLIRLMIQTKAPAILMYSDKIEVDKNFILINFDSAPSDVKKFVLKAANDASIFTPEELTKIK